MSAPRAANQSPGLRTRLRAWGIYAVTLAFAFIEVIVVLMGVSLIVTEIIDPLLWHFYPIFREPFDPLISSNSSNRAIPGTIRGVTLAGFFLIGLYGWAYVRRRVSTWPYERFSSPAFRANLGIPATKPTKPVPGWVAIVVGVGEGLLALFVSVLIAALALQAVISDWSVTFLLIGPVGWVVLRIVVAVRRDSGPWPYANQPNDLLYYAAPPRDRAESRSSTGSVDRDLVTLRDFFRSRIEHKAIYSHPRERVWQALVESEMVGWPEGTDLDDVPVGKTVELEDDPHFSDGTVQVTLVQINQYETLVVFVDVGSGLSIEITWSLEHIEDGTRLTVTYAGFTGLRGSILMTGLRSEVKVMYDQTLPEMLRRLEAGDSLPDPGTVSE